MKIMLSGASGVMGCSLVETCKEWGIECVPTDIDELDITSSVAIRNSLVKNQPDAFINVAVLQAINVCEHDPVKAFNINSIQYVCVS